MRDAVILIDGGGWVVEYSWSSGSLGRSRSSITRGKGMEIVEFDHEHDEQAPQTIRLGNYPSFPKRKFPRKELPESSSNRFDVSTSYCRM